MKNFRKRTNIIWFDRDLEITTGYDENKGYFMMIEDVTHPYTPPPKRLAEKYINPRSGLIYCNTLDCFLPYRVHHSPEYYFEILAVLGILVDEPMELFCPQGDS